MAPRCIFGYVRVPRFKGPGDVEQKTACGDWQRALLGGRVTACGCFIDAIRLWEAYMRYRMSFSGYVSGCASVGADSAAASSLAVTIRSCPTLTRFPTLCPGTLLMCCSCCYRIVFIYQLLFLRLQRGTLQHMSLLIALAAVPGMLGTQEAIRQSQQKERREEHRARRCNLIVRCIKSSQWSRELDGRPLVLRNGAVRTCRRVNGYHG